MDLDSPARKKVIPPRIVGIVLVRNEDLLVERAIRNSAYFCDEWILCEHRSNDRTPDILRRLAADLPAARVHRIFHPRESHQLIREYAGQNVWVFGLDGDEVYDPEGLGRMRSRIHAGEFASWWMVLGNVLHVTRIDRGHASAEGYLAPPCRSMTKLYNFSAIDSWDGYCVERLHGGSPQFRKPFDAKKRLALYESVPWEESDFRCLHLCFQPRSSNDFPGRARANIMETLGPVRWLEWLAPWRKLRAGWKQERYRRGPELTVDARPFFAAN